MAPITRKRARLVESYDDKENAPNVASKPKQAKLTNSIQHENNSNKPSAATTSKVSASRATAKTTKVKAKPTSKPTSSRATATAPKADKAIAKKHNVAIKAIDKEFKKLLKQYKPNPTIWQGVTSDNFAKMIAGFLPIVDELLDAGAPKEAFNLLMVMGDHCYGDLEACLKSSGWGGTEKPFQKMDKKMLEVIDKRVEVEPIMEGAKENVEEEPEPESELKAVMRLLGGKDRPNKQEWGWIQKARRTDLMAKFEWMQKRRETVVDWVGNTLMDLKKTRDEIDGYGIGDHFFKESIEKLEKLKGS